MSLLDSLGSYYIPGAGKHSDVSPPRGAYFQTSGTVVATNSVIMIAAKTTTSENIYHITGLHVTCQGQSTTSLPQAYVGPDQIAHLATGNSLQIKSYNFGERGIVGPDFATTTSLTNTAYLRDAVNKTLFKRWVLTGYKEA